VGIVDIYSDATIYKWDKGVENYTPQSLDNIYVYERGFKNN
jgi:hypothetical protein